MSKEINLSVLETEKAFDIVLKITPAVGKIMKDEEIKKVFNDRLNREDYKDITDEEFNNLTMNKGIEMISNLIPLLLGNYRNEIFLILASVTEQTTEEVKKQNVFETIKQIKQLLTNESLMGFLM